MDLDIEYYKEQLEAKEDMLARTTNYLIETQNDLEEKNKKISELYQDTLDSIDVAQHIQESLLPDVNILKSYFKNSAYFIKQKALVGGDTIFIKNNNEGVQFGLLDATGHGIPAAMLSISCTLLLRELSSSVEVKDSKTLLNLLDYQLEKAFDIDNKLSVAQAEGIILGYCSKDNTLNYCSAKGKGFLVSKSGEILDLIPIKKSLGDLNKIKLYNTTINLEQVQKLVIYSDGLTDQFGGENDRLFTKKRLKNIVTQHFEEDADTLSKIIMQEFQNWRNDTPQTDDISFIIIDF
jgi:phosphoserine phosphatase RsbU/P